MKKTILNLKEIQELARKGATDEEIAAHYDCRTSTISNRGKKALRLGRTLLEMDLRKAQVEAALGGNYSMLAYLGRELLGQSGKARDHSDEPPTPTVEKRMTTKQLHKLIGKEPNK